MQRSRIAALFCSMVALIASAQAKVDECDDWRSAMERAHPDAVAPEPTAPAAECNFVREVRCVPPSPVRSAWQMDPFSQCPRSIDAWNKNTVGPRATKAGFSRRETRARRLGRKKECKPTPSEGDCCYVQFSATACD
jgi:hypothetical protein